jgi:uncharacterized protein
VHELIARPELLAKVDRTQLSAGTFTLDDILEELKKPGRDPRQQFLAPCFAEGVREISDAQPGMVLEGVVTNVTGFGAFIDIGVHQDGLVHISEISTRYIKDPNEVLKAGQIVKVKVLTVDVKTKRIALSIKALEAAPQAVLRRPQPPKSQQSKPQPPKPQAPKPVAQPQPTVEQKLAQLSSKWKVR